MTDTKIKFWGDWQTKKNEFEDIQMWWNTGKLYIKSLTIEYARDMYYLRKNQKSDLLRQLREEQEKDKEKERKDLTSCLMDTKI